MFLSLGETTHPGSMTRAAALLHFPVTNREISNNLEQKTYRTKGHIVLRNGLYINSQTKLDKTLPKSDHF